MHYLAGSFVALALLLGGCFCGAGPNQTEISMYVTDGASGTPIRSPAFTEQGSPLSASCQERQASDPTLCMAELLVLDPALHTITVSAPGYAPQTVTVDTQENGAVHLAVNLQPAP